MHFIILVVCFICSIVLWFLVMPLAVLLFIVIRILKLLYWLQMHISLYVIDLRIKKTLNKVNKHEY